MKIKFVKEDLWIGLYYKNEFTVHRSKQAGHDDIYTHTTTYYLCLIPCLPIIWQRSINVPLIVIQGLPAYRGITWTST